MIFFLHAVAVGDVVVPTSGYGGQGQPAGRHLVQRGDERACAKAQPLQWEKALDLLRAMEAKHPADRHLVQ